MDDSDDGRLQFIVELVAAGRSDAHPAGPQKKKKRRRDPIFIRHQSPSGPDRDPTTQKILKSPKCQDGRVKRMEEV